MKEVVIVPALLQKAQWAAGRFPCTYKPGEISSSTAALSPAVAARQCSPPTMVGRPSTGAAPALPAWPSVHENTMREGAATTRRTQLKLTATRWR